MTGKIMHHLAAAGRMTDVNCILQVEMIGDGLQIIGIVVHVMSIAGLSRATMSAAISCNDAETLAEEEKHLRVPVIGRQRPAMTEDDRLTFAPVFIINLDVLPAFFSCGYVWHVNLPPVHVALKDVPPAAESALTNPSVSTSRFKLRLRDFLNVALC